MKRLLVVISMLCLWTGTASALQVAGVNLSPVLQLHNRTLHLNGYGIRKKFFFKIYVGSLYSVDRLTSGEAALRDSGDKLIRMNFLYSRVEPEKIVEAFADGLRENSPAVAGTADARRFLGLFRNDFVRGDQVDLYLGGDGTVTASHNGRLLGVLHSVPLARAVLAIYLGQNPADDDLKAGMLGH